MAFGLDAVTDLGSIDATLWASGRALDASCERVSYDQDATSFRSLAEDTADPVVQAELSWQADAVASLEGPGTLAEIAARLLA